tara:strand:- start:902 stop:1072 length:171 start_codon:yes stop_codon:yes gene_type:complete
MVEILKDFFVIAVAAIVIPMWAYFLFRMIFGSYYDARKMFIGNLTKKERGQNGKKE